MVTLAIIATSHLAADKVLRNDNRAIARLR